MKSYYPINLDVFKKKCLVVGGGPVAERKARLLLKFGAAVSVVAPDFTSGITKLAKIGKIVLFKRKYKKIDLVQAQIVIAATADHELNEIISKQARRSKVPVNVVDNPTLCTFITPSVIKRGPLVVSISTSGQSPSLARFLRLSLQKLIDPELGKLAKKLGQLRKKTGSPQK